MDKYRQSRAHGSKRAEAYARRVLERAGWKVELRPERTPANADFIIRKSHASYVVDVKAASEARSDRLVPLLAQAVLQAQHAAGNRSMPLALVVAPSIPVRVAGQILEFASKYAPDAAVGVLDYDGLERFRGPHFKDLNADPVQRARPSHKHAALTQEPRRLFSDLNQWMLKVLLATEVPEHLLSAPRGQFRNATQLARAAGVSVMSAFRFVQQLEAEGYLDESSLHLRLVRRADLFQRWQASADRRVPEIGMRFRLRGDSRLQLRKMLDSGRACLALFAAADALGLGFVHGVPPHVYVERVQPPNLAAWKNLQPCDAGEPPDLLLRRAPFPQSIFRGLVRPHGLAACDVFQVWLDVSSHPSRGREQADVIRQRVLDAIIGASA